MIIIIQIYLFNFFIMSFLSKSIKRIQNLDEPISSDSFPYVVKVIFFIGDIARAQYFAVDNLKHLNYLHEIFRLLDFCVSFAVGTPDTIKQL